MGNCTFSHALYSQQEVTDANPGFPGGASGKESACSVGDVGDTGSVPGSRRSLGEGNGNPLQCSCPESPMNRGAWRATAHGVAESDSTELPAHTLTPGLPRAGDRRALAGHPDGREAPGALAPGSPPPPPQTATGRRPICRPRPPSHREPPGLRCRLLRPWSLLTFMEKEQLLLAGPIHVLLKMHTLLKQKQEVVCSSSSEAIREGKLGPWGQGL